MQWVFDGREAKSDLAEWLQQANMLANEHIMHYGDKFVQVKDNRNSRKYR